MSAALGLGLLLGAGLVLCASPLLWPRAARAPRRPSVALARLGDLLIQAGLPAVRPVVLLTGCALAGGLLATIALAVSGIAVLAPIAGVAGLLAPVAVLRWRADARRRAARGTWPDLVDHLVSAARSGRPLVEAIGSLGETGPPRTRPACAAFARDVRATGDVDDAFDRLKHRLADPVADRIVEILRMTRDVGGTELVPVLRATSASLRQEAAVRSEAEARQSWVRSAARIGVAAPWVVLALLATRPEAVAAYESPGGTALLVAGALVTVVAYRLMLALGRLPEDGRWSA